MVRCPQCDILLCEKDDCQEPLCVTDPDSETGRSLPAPASAAEEDEDKTRMMASTTVFVVEPGVTALGRLIQQLQMPYQCNVTLGKNMCLLILGIIFYLHGHVFPSNF